MQFMSPFFPLQTVVLAAKLYSCTVFSTLFLLYICVSVYKSTTLTFVYLISLYCSIFSFIKVTINVFFLSPHLTKYGCISEPVVSGMPWTMTFLKYMFNRESKKPGSTEDHRRKKKECEIMRKSVAENQVGANCHRTPGKRKDRTDESKMILRYLKLHYIIWTVSRNKLFRNSLSIQF